MNGLVRAFAYLSLFVLGCIVAAAYATWLLGPHLRRDLFPWPRKNNRSPK